MISFERLKAAAAKVAPGKWDRVIARVYGEGAGTAMDNGFAA